MGSLAIRSAAVVLLALSSSAASAQEQAAGPPNRPAGLAVGLMAPDFVVSGATRYGVLRDSVRLSDFRGQTVVVAFFPKARTKG